MEQEVETVKEIEAIRIETKGPGIIFYSRQNVRHIKDGENYLEANYILPENVLSHVYSGTIVGFGTGSPGDYVISIGRGVPSDLEVDRHEFRLRLYVDLPDGELIFRDLYDLFCWRVEVHPNQRVHVGSGRYLVTLLTNLPESGVLGDNQKIDIYFEPVAKPPSLRFDGVPQLCW